MGKKKKKNTVFEPLPVEDEELSAMEAEAMLVSSEEETNRLIMVPLSTWRHCKRLLTSLTHVALTRLI